MRQFVNDFQLEQFKVLAEREKRRLANEAKIALGESGKATAEAEAVELTREELFEALDGPPEAKVRWTQEHISSLIDKLIEKPFLINLPKQAADERSALLVAAIVTDYPTVSATCASEVHAYQTTDDDNLIRHIQHAVILRYLPVDTDIKATIRTIRARV